MVSAETHLKERTPLISTTISSMKSLKYSQCVDLGVVLVAKLASVSEK